MTFTILPVSVLAKRKPLLLFRLVGLFLLRLAERSLLGLLFQEPPRRTRAEQGASQGCGGLGRDQGLLRQFETEAENRIATTLERIRQIQKSNGGLRPPCPIQVRLRRRGRMRGPVKGLRFKG
jgi:hypothetical protein